MTTVEDMLNRVRKVDLDFETEESINDVRDVYVKEQREQLYTGKLSTGEPIEPEYSDQTVRSKKRKGQPFNRVTLKDTGEFYKNIFLDVREDIFVIDSADPKTDKLVEKYSEDIFGLNERRTNTFVKELEPVFINRIKKVLEL